MGIGIGSIVGWVLSGGATSVIDVAGKAITSVGGPLADAYASKQKALTDVHGMDVKAATEITLKGYDTDLRLNELSTGLAQIDATNEKSSWMRKVAFSISAYVAACAAFQYTFPKLASDVGVDVSKMPEMWSYVFIAVFLAIVGLRYLEKRGNASTVTKMQSTIATTPRPSIFGKFLPARDQPSG